MKNPKVAWTLPSCLAEVITDANVNCEAKKEIVALTSSPPQPPLSNCSFCSFCYHHHILVSSLGNVSWTTQPSTYRFHRNLGPAASVHPTELNIYTLVNIFTLCTSDSDWWQANSSWYVCNRRDPHLTSQLCSLCRYFPISGIIWKTFYCLHYFLCYSINTG